MGDSLSACLIVQDEEERLPGCLDSLAFCDEIVVVDGGSRDRTAAIACEAGAKLIENPWPGFAAQRNVALDAATGDWILEIDADERVSPRLRSEILAMLADPPPAETRIAALATRELFLGRELGPAIRFPRYRHRLFRRGAFRHDESRTVHEGLWPDGPTLVLDGELVHVFAADWREALRDTVDYARLESRQRGRVSPAGAVVGIFLRPLAKIAYRSILYGAWRDGWQGLVKVALESGGDSLATVYRLRESSVGDHADPAPPRRGPVRIVGFALQERPAGRLDGWLARAARAGADVALISPGRTGGDVPRRRLAKATPGAALRALDAEEQARPVDALLLAGRRERLLLRLAPAGLRGAMPPLGPEESPESAVRLVQDRTRPAETAL